MPKQPGTKKFNGVLFRFVQRFPYKSTATSYAKGLRKKGIPMNPHVLARVTKERLGWTVWMRGK